MEQIKKLLANIDSSPTRIFYGYVLSEYIHEMHYHDKEKLIEELRQVVAAQSSTTDEVDEWISIEHKLPKVDPHKPSWSIEVDVKNIANIIHHKCRFWFLFSDFCDSKNRILSSTITHWRYIITSLQ